MAQILIVEDEESIIKLIRIRLERLGHSINAADNGVTALEIARESLPDLILLDVMIPALNGLQVLQPQSDPRPRRSRAHAHCPRPRADIVAVKAVPMTHHKPFSFPSDLPVNALARHGVCGEPISAE